MITTVFNLAIALIEGRNHEARGFARTIDLSEYKHIPAAQKRLLEASTWLPSNVSRPS